MIAKYQVEKVQKIWANAVVTIGVSFKERRDYIQKTKEVMLPLYLFDEQDILFKPTKASKTPFRLTSEGALSYFVSGNRSFSEDKGFALQPWKLVRFENASLHLTGEIALAMGEYFFTDYDNNTIKVEYSFGYQKKADNSLGIILHHSSLPYQG